MEITVRVEVQYLAPEHAVLLDVLQMFRRPMWVRFMMRYISPRLKTTSPADKTVLESLEREWRVPTSPPSPSAGCKATSDMDALHPQLLGQCVICMGDTPRPAIEHVRLPCGHAFHYLCVQSWLQLRSTCPVCRFQFRKAFAGTYAVHSLSSTVLLEDHHRALSQEQVLRTSVEKQLVRAVVNVTLVKVLSEEKKKEYPCELSAFAMHADGECFAEYDVYPENAEGSRAPCDPSMGSAVKEAELTNDRVGRVRARTECDLHGDDLVDGDQQHCKRLRHT